MSLRDLPVQTLTGEPTTLGALTGGRAALVVNVASRCGLTPQYAALERLHEERDDLVVIGVPCNQFAGQEPGSAQEIAEFCSATYGVTFPMLAKADVNGDGRAPLFDALTAVAGRRRRRGRRAVELREVAPVAGRRAGRPLPPPHRAGRPAGARRGRPRQCGRLIVPSETSSSTARAAASPSTAASSTAAGAAHTNRR